MAIKNIQQSDIPFSKGMHRNPSSPGEGELSECVNLMPRNGELVGMPVPQPTGITFQGDGGGKEETLVCVHTVGTEKHYITLRNNWGANQVKIYYRFKLVMGPDDNLDLYSDYIFDGQGLTLLVEYGDGRTETCALLMTGSVCRVPSRVYDTDTGNVTGASITDFHPESANTLVEVLDGRETPYTPAKAPLRVARYTLAWFTEADQERREIRSSGSRPQQVLAQGSMLIYREDGGVRYLIWREGGYAFLSGGLPEIDAQLALSGNFCVERVATKVKLVKGEEAQTFDELLFTVSDPTALANTPTDGSTRVLSESERMLKGQTYRIYNYSKCTVRVLIASKLNYPTAYGDCDTSMARYIQPNSYRDISPRFDVAVLRYRGIYKGQHGTFVCLLRVYKGSQKEGAALGDTKENLQALMGAANKFLSVCMSDAGKFALPFFARVGLRLYDGSVTRLSAPALMTPNSGCAPYVLLFGNTPGDYTVNVYGSQCDLQFRLSDTVVQNLRLWKDIVRSVVVAVTPAIYNYNEGYEYKEGETGLESREVKAYPDGMSGLYGNPYTESKTQPQEGQLHSYTVDTEDTGAWYDSTAPFSMAVGDAVLCASCEPGDMVLLRKLDGEGHLERVASLAVGEEYIAEEAGVYYPGADPAQGKNSKGSFYVVEAKYAGYAHVPISDLLSLTGDFSVTEETTLTQAVLPHFEKKEVDEKVLGQGNFYVWGECPVEDLKAGWTTIEPDGRDLTAVETFERVPDDNHSHNKIDASVLFSYNSRLHLGNITECLWGGGCLERMTGYAEDWQERSSSSRVVVSLLKGGVSLRVDSGWGESLSRPSHPTWFFYPDSDAVGAVIYERAKGDNGGFAYWESRIPLTRHKLLEGAYWYGDPNSVPSAACSEEEACVEVSQDSVAYTNKLYASETDNPVLFPTTQRLSVGSGSILALSTTSTAFSQNPYGRSALQVFCTDGIWELEPSDTGRYVCKNPTSRDVLSNVGSVTMLDQATSFVTASGLKMLTEQGVRSVDDALAGFNVSEDNPALLEPVRAVAERFGLNPPVVSDKKVSAELMQGARIAYDYVHNALHVFMGLNDKWHYVLDTVSGEWSMQVLPYSVRAIVPDYPNTLLQASDGVLYRYGDAPDTERQMSHYEVGYALTRPLSLGDPLARKMLCDLRVVAERTTRASAVSVAVYASNDRQNWYSVKSLKAFSAKWYRLLVVTHFNELDALGGVSIQHVRRFDNKLR